MCPSRRGLVVSEPPVVAQDGLWYSPGMTLTVDKMNAAIRSARDVKDAYDRLSRSFIMTRNAHRRFSAVVAGWKAVDALPLGTNWRKVKRVRRKAELNYLRQR